jgi:hypothetical protein
MPHRGNISGEKSGRRKKFRLTNLIGFGKILGGEAGVLRRVVH